jgi:hypothetical protein
VVDVVTPAARAAIRAAASIRALDAVRGGRQGGERSRQTSRSGRARDRRVTDRSFVVALPELGAEAAAHDDRSVEDEIVAERPRCERDHDHRHEPGAERHAAPARAARGVRQSRGERGKVREEDRPGERGQREAHRGRDEPARARVVDRPDRAIDGERDQR